MLNHGFYEHAQHPLFCRNFPILHSFLYSTENAYFSVRVAEISGAVNPQLALDYSEVPVIENIEPKPGEVL